jgi:UDP:flavonoid glycosyltransferase YjiC (YdhE family)
MQTLGSASCHTGDLQLIARANTADGRESAGVVVFLALDEPEPGLPDPIIVADRVPQLSALHPR